MAVCGITIKSFNPTTIKQRSRRTTSNKFKLFSMRIIGYIEHPQLKITVFKMNNKLSVKFESGLYEQTYKFRESEDLKNIEQMKHLVDNQLIIQVEQGLAQMHQIKNQALSRYLPPVEDNEFDTLI